MKRGIRRMTVDFHFDGPAPEVGNVVRELRHDGTLKRYSRVTGVRQVQMRVSRGARARYRLLVERLAAPPETGATFDVTDYPPKPKVDRFSPLLPADGEG